jgi:hypothetical protein
LQDEAISSTRGRRPPGEPGSAGDDGSSRSIAGRKG